MQDKNFYTKQTEALKLVLSTALEALEFYCVSSEDGEDLTPMKIKKAIAAIREALSNIALDQIAENERELGLDYMDLQDKDPELVEHHYKQVIEGVRTMFNAKREQSAQQEIEELTAQRDKLADILTRTANALKGQPAELSAHSWHDLPEVAQHLKTALVAKPHEQQEPVAYDKTEINCFAQNLYDQKMREGRHGHYESMFHVIHQCIKKVAPPPRKPWVGLTDEERADVYKSIHANDFCVSAVAIAIETKLKEKNA